MSELARLLLGDLAPGVYPWSSPATPEEVRRDAETAGWRFVHLDTSTVVDKAGFLDTAATAFGFPGWFGRNWDALADSLGDVRSERGTIVLWDGSGPFATVSEQQFAVALDILRDRAESGLGGPFAVLVRTDRPVPAPD